MTGHQVTVDASGLGAKRCSREEGFGVRNGIVRRTFCAGVALAAALLLLSACNLLALHRDLRAGANAGGVAGQVRHGESDASVIVVFALREEGDAWVADNYVHLATQQDFLMRLVAGQRYRIGAFADRNDNLRPDAGEPAVLLSDPVTVAQGWKGVTKLNLTLTPAGRLGRTAAEALQHLPQVELRPLPLAIGEVTDLDDERFSAESGSMGLWRPFEFLANVGIGVFFLEPYDPKRTPVLFVSGAGGNPREWRSMIEALDRARYQPWVFVYPSGQRLASSAMVLDHTVSALRREYGFGGLVVTAHSMGGLVARDFIQRNAGNGGVPVFVSLVTPWRGHPAASIGVRRSPAVIPSWIDMQTDSEFQQAIFARPFPATTAYYLFYAQTDPAQPPERATDGTIAVSSQLHPDAVRDAREVLGFTENHTSVLRSPEVIAAYLRVLGTTAR
ncbi:MAG: esterase/lipase family protein [Burkholderiales bacterium]